MTRPPLRIATLQSREGTGQVLYPREFRTLAAAPPVPSNARSLGAAAYNKRTEQPSASAGRWHLLALGLVLSFLGFVGALTLLLWMTS